MSGVNETRFLVKHESCKCKCGLIESVYNPEQIWNVGVNVKNYMIEVLAKMIISGILGHFECNKAGKIDEYWDIKNCSCKKCLIGKLVLECKKEILNTIETSLDDEKEACEKNNCLIHMMSLVIICLLLLAVASIGCYYYYTRDWIKKNAQYHSNIKWII